MPDLYKTLGARIKDLRRGKRLSRANIYEICPDLPVEKLIAIEERGAKPTLTEAGDLARIFNMMPEKFLKGTGLELTESGIVPKKTAAPSPAP